MKTRVSCPNAKGWTKVPCSPDERVCILSEDWEENEADRLMRKGYKLHSLWPRKRHRERVEKCWKELGIGTGARMQELDDVLVTATEETTEYYVQPLADMSNEFFDCLQHVLYNLYPLSSSRMWKRKGNIYGAVTKVYWLEIVDDWKGMTPPECAQYLNQMLGWLEEHRAKNIFDSKRVAGEIEDDWQAIFEAD